MYTIGTRIKVRKEISEAVSKEKGCGGKHNVEYALEGMLAVGAGLSPYDRSSLIGHFAPVFGDILAVALHITLHSPVPPKNR